MFYNIKLFILIVVMFCYNVIYTSTALQRLEEYNNEMHQLRSGQQLNGHINEASDKAIKLFTGVRISSDSTQRADSRNRKAIRTAIMHRIMGQPYINKFTLEESIHIGHDAAVALVHKTIILLRQDNASFLFNIDDVVQKIRANQDDIFKYLNVAQNAHWSAVDQYQRNCSDDQIKKILGKHFMTQYLVACRYYHDVKRQDIICVRGIKDGDISTGSSKL